MYNTTKSNKHIPQVPVGFNCEDRLEADVCACVCVCVNEDSEGMLDGRYERCLGARGKSLEEVGEHCEKKRQR